MSEPPPYPGNIPSAPPRAPAIQAALDTDHLKLLEIGFYISGVVTALRFIWFFFIAAFFVVAGVGTAYSAHHPNNGTSGNPPPAFVFFILASVFGFILVLTLAFTGFEIYAGLCLKNRRHPILIQVVAAFYCLSIPWGTALGVCTFMVLNRPSVKALFGKVSTST